MFRNAGTAYTYLIQSRWRYTPAVQIDVASLTAGQIAILAGSATLLAALVSATAALTVAWVNAAAAKRLSRTTAKRHLRLRAVEKYCDVTESRFALFEECMDYLRYGKVPEATATIDRIQMEAKYIYMYPILQRGLLEAPALSAHSKDLLQAETKWIQLACMAASEPADQKRFDELKSSYTSALQVYLQVKDDIEEWLI